MAISETVVKVEGRVDVTRRGALVELWLTRPQRDNAFDLGLAVSFRDAVVEAIDDPRVRVLVIRARGRAFSLGGDVIAMSEAKDRAGYVVQLAAVMHEAIAALATARMMTVAVVDGAVAGAGLGIALVCDQVVATSRSRFIPAYSSVGLTPDCGVSALLPRAVGLATARRMLLGGAALRAADAERLGLVSELIGREEVESRVSELADLAAGPSARAIADSAGLLRGNPAALVAQLDEELSTIARASRSPEAAQLLAEMANRLGRL